MCKQLDRNTVILNKICRENQNTKRDIKEIVLHIRSTMTLMISTAMQNMLLALGDPEGSIENTSAIETVSDEGSIEEEQSKNIVRKKSTMINAETQTDGD